MAIIFNIAIPRIEKEQSYMEKYQLRASKLVRKAVERKKIIKPNKCEECGKILEKSKMLRNLKPEKT